MSKINHIIWDWNGTLVDDGWLFVDLINQVLKKRKMKEITLNDYRQAFCFPLEKYYQKLGFNFNAEPYEVPSMEFVELYDKNKFRPQLYKKATHLLNLLKNAGIKNHLLSAQNQESLLELVNFYGISNLFESILGTDNFHARGKPLVARKLINTIEAKKSEILFIGDTNLDMKIALGEDSSAVAVTYGHQSRDRFPNQKNILFVDSFNELFDLLSLKF